MTLFKKEFVVSNEMTAKVMGSGDLSVLATPALVACVENTCKEFVAPELANGETTVGSLIELEHLRPSKVDAVFTVEIVALEKQRKLQFRFDVFEGEQKIATGKHIRAVVQTDQFLARL